jgi:PTH1 family peptidyl-tRNA hydrolase
VLSAAVTLIVGLGNPGPQYEATRHNAGFWFVDEVARQFGGQFRAESKFHGEVAKVSINGHQVWLLKPQTFMNRSGQSLAALARFYKIPLENILVVHDELDLPPGTARLKQGGGHGGHNGLRDIVAHMGGKDFMRLRIGIGHPGNSKQVSDYVLSRAGADDQRLIEASLSDAMAVLPQVVDGEFQKAMNELHTER